MTPVSAYQVLQQACCRYSKRELAAILEVNPSTFRRWEVNEEIPSYRVDAIRQRILPLISAPANADHAFTFIDLFAGIGGIRYAFEQQGGHCVFTSEWNSFAQKTYLANFPQEPDHQLAGDITQIDAQDIPNHDVLLAGFPCQPFSIAGVSKKNALGRPHGFADLTQGTLFYDVARIIAARKPKAFLLENVKNLVSHDKGATFSTILKVLREELDYEVHYKIIDGARFVPQHRERLMIVGFREPAGFMWDDLRLPEKGPLLSSILHPQDGSEATVAPWTTGAKAVVDKKYTLTPRLWAYLQGYAAKHRAAGNGFGFGLVDGNSVARTLSARYYKDGSEILVSQGKRKRPRRLTPRECARLMGFPDTFQIPVSDTQAYKQFAMSSVVPMVSEVAKCVVEKLSERSLMPANLLRDGAFPTSGNWTPEQLKLAFSFYCQTPFGQLHGRNPKVIALAKLIGRTPSALAMKCCNFASLDPAVQARGVAGLGNASNADRKIWNEFHADWDCLAVECNQLIRALNVPIEVDEHEDQAVDVLLPQDFTGVTRQAVVELRVKQSFFRQAVLSGYRNRCCITGISDTRLLVASHIVAWRDDPSIRLHPSNGLCLSSLHDKAFDSHLFSLTDDCRVVLSKAMEQTGDTFLRDVFWPIQDRQIGLPERFRPEPAFLQRHREQMQGNQ